MADGRTSREYVDTLALANIHRYNLRMVELPRGAVIAGHRIEEVAGRGGMGVVYRARHLALDRTVALKLIAPGLIEDATARARFEKESIIAASLDHPNVIPVYYTGEEDGAAFIAMRYVPGDDLRTLVRREGRLAPVRAARIVAQAGAALDAAHARGLVHRDVKPANVLLGPDDHVYLSDFGLARHAMADGSTRTGQWVGTVDYVAPEQIRGERVDARADVYALGGVLYFALTGRPPYPRELDEAKLWAHVNEPPPVPSGLVADLPGEFDAVLARAMAKAPKDRYPSAGDLGHASVTAAAAKAVRQPERQVAIGEAAPDEQETTTATGLTVAQPHAATRVLHPPPVRRRRRNGRAPLLALAAVALLAVGAAATLLEETPSEEVARSTPPARAETARGPRVVATIAAGNRPNAIALAGDRVWMTRYRSRQLLGVDARTNRRLRTRPTVGAGGQDVTSGFGSLWVAVAGDRRLVRLDPRRGRLQGTPLSLPAPPMNVAVGRGSVWVSTLEPGGQDRLLRVDPSRGAITSTTLVPGGIRSVAVSPEAVWLISRRDPLVFKLDPRTGRIINRLRVGRVLWELVYRDGALWVSDIEGDAIHRIDPRTGNFVTIGTGDGPRGIAVRGREVWVTNFEDHTVTRVDARTSRVRQRQISVGLNPYAITLDRRSAWVTSVGENAVTRVDYR